MLATIVYAVNPNQATPVDGFTGFAHTAEQALKRKQQLEADIESGAYRRWSGADRRSFVDRCINNGWKIEVKTCMIG